MPMKRKSLPTNMSFTVEERCFIYENRTTLTAKQMARVIGCQDQTVYNFIQLAEKDSSVVYLEPPRGKGVRMPLREFEKRFIRDNINSMPIWDIVAHLGCAGKTLYDFIRAENLKKLDPKRQKRYVPEVEKTESDFFTHDKYYMI